MFKTIEAKGPCEGAVAQTEQLTKTIETLNVQECVSYLRAHGLRISYEKLRAGLQQGAYPFGHCIDCGKSMAFEIYKRLLDEWIAERETPVQTKAAGR